MVGKSSVSALQEFCAKHKFLSPTYEYIDSTDGSYISKCTIMDVDAHGNGRSKRDAKHQAAANAIKKLRLSFPDIDEIPQMAYEETPTTDMIIRLRDYCVQHQHPLPIIEIIQQAGTPDAPEFTAMCTLASLRRYGVSEKKKDAKQKAALEMLRVIVEDVDQLDHQMQVATLEAKAEDVEAERYHKFKTYRELTESKTGEMPGVLLCDRHNYFAKFYDELKKEAFNILKTSYESHQEQALDLLRALKIKPKNTIMPTINTAERLILIEMNCDYDAVIVGPETKVYEMVVNYFRDVL